MHPTHAVAPCLMLAGHLPKRVYGRGSGKIRDELVAQYNSPFAFESALIELENSDLTIEMERFLYGVAAVILNVFASMVRRRALSGNS